MRQVVFRSPGGGRGVRRTTFNHYIYKNRGLPIPLRQHLLRELLRLRSGEISYILITAEGQDARFKNEMIAGETADAI